MTDSKTNTMTVIDLLHRAHQAATAVFLEHGTELTLRQVAVLRAVQAKPGSSQAGLVDETGIDRSTMADIVRRLLQKGYVDRVVNKEDVRCKLVTLSKKGEQEIAKVNIMAAKTEAALMEKIPMTKQKHFREALSALSAQ